MGDMESLERERELRIEAEAALERERIRCQQLMEALTAVRGQMNEDSHRVKEFLKRVKQFSQQMMIFADALADEMDDDEDEEEEEQRAQEEEQENEVGISFDEGQPNGEVEKLNGDEGEVVLQPDGDVDMLANGDGEIEPQNGHGVDLPPGKMKVKVTRKVNKVAEEDQLVVPPETNEPIVTQNDDQMILPPTPPRKKRVLITRKRFFDSNGEPFKLVVPLERQDKELTERIKKWAETLPPEMRRIHESYSGAGGAMRIPDHVLNPPKELPRRIRHGGAKIPSKRLNASPPGSSPVRSASEVTQSGQSKAASSASPSRESLSPDRMQTIPPTTTSPRQSPSAMKRSHKSAFSLNPEVTFGVEPQQKIMRTEPEEAEFDVSGAFPFLFVLVNVDS
jgi:hypothetical protein